MYIEQKISSVADRVSNLERTSNYNVILLMKKIEEMQAEINKLKEAKNG